MSSLGRSVTLVFLPGLILGWGVESRAAEIEEPRKAWYFLGSDSSGGSASGRDQQVFELESNRRGLDEFREGRRYTFSLRYSDLDTPTGQIGFGRGPDPYGAEDVLAFYLDHTFDFGDDFGLRPHVLAGMGLAYGTGLDRQEELGPALELGVGASYELSDHWDFFTEYRAFYTGTAEPSLRTQESDSGFAQNFMLGARLRF